MPLLPYSFGRPGSGRRVSSGVRPETRPDPLTRLCVERFSWGKMAEGASVVARSIEVRQSPKSPSIPPDSAPLALPQRLGGRAFVGMDACAAR
jgi:hypothetical protein